MERFFDSLAESDVPLERCRLVCLVDSADSALIEAVRSRMLALPCPDLLLHVTAWPPPVERCKSRERRGRHAAMRTASVGLIPDANLLLLLEDDTLVPKNAWNRLIKAYSQGYDWISGFEVGRWSCPCPGIWDMSKPGYRRSMMPGSAEVEECDATGVYLVLTRPEVYRARPWDVWDNAYGHDVSITWLLKQDGYRLGVDWTLTCTHITQEGDLTCDMAQESVNPHPMPAFSPRHLDIDITPLTEFPAEGPARGTPRYKQDARKYRLGKDVEMDGDVYRKGTSVDHATAREMYERGLIASVIV